MAIAICWIQQTKKNRSRKNGDKDGKTMYKLIKNGFINFQLSQNIIQTN